MGHGDFGQLKGRRKRETPILGRPDFLGGTNPYFDTYKSRTPPPPVSKAVANVRSYRGEPLQFFAMLGLSAKKGGGDLFFFSFFVFSRSSGFLLPFRLGPASPDSCSSPAPFYCFARLAEARREVLKSLPIA